MFKSKNYFTIILALSYIFTGTSTTFVACAQIYTNSTIAPNPPKPLYETIFQTAFGTLLGAGIGSIASLFLMRTAVGSYLHCIFHGPYGSKHKFLYWTAFGATLGGVTTWVLINNFTSTP